ncbi:MAG: cell division ATPase MinD [Candidatus Hydrothermarchaeales archaeon]
MGESIVVASGKGGVGKTNISINLGAAMAQLGKRVTVLDADIEMANVELRLRLEKGGKSLHDVLAGNADIFDAVYDGPAGLKVVPCGTSLEGLRAADPSKLGEVLGELLKTTDILVIDAPAGLGTSMGAMAVAHEMLIVVNPEIASIADAMKVKQVFQELDGHLLGIVVNRATYHEEDLKIHEIEALLDAEVISVVPEDRAMKQAAAYGSPLVISAPYSPAARAIKKLAENIITNEFGPKEPPKEDMVSRIIFGLFGGRSKT